MNLEMVRQFKRVMVAETTAYQKALEAAAGRTRYAVADVLQNSRPGTIKAARAVKGELEGLKKSAEEINARYGDKVVRLAERFAVEQIGMAGDAVPGVADFAEVKAAVETTVKRILRLKMGTPVWVETGQLKLVMEMNRMSASGEDAQAIYERLLATEMMDGRASVWRSMTNSMSLASDRMAWDLAMAIVQAYLENAEQLSVTKQRWQKQAIAAIDERTTDCCLQAHGQTQALDKPFRLTGTPRYADEMQHSPFHWYCRTSVTLYLPEFEESGIRTEEMREAAQAEIEARKKTGKREVIHPADATSRRNL